MVFYNLLIRSMGWDPEIKLPKDIKSHYELENKPFVGCLSHSNNWEFLLWILYRYANPIFNKHPPVLLMVGSLVDRFSWITKRMNCIGIYKDQKNGKTNYQRVIDEINKLNTRLVILDPSGDSRYPIPWKNGYYRIAQELKWDIRVLGFDFEKKQLVLGNPISYTLPQDQVESFLKHEIKEIVPLRPQNLCTSVRDHDINQLAFISNTSAYLWLIFLTLIIFGLIYLTHYYLSDY